MADLKSIKAAIFQAAGEYNEALYKPRRARKVTVVGVGQVGMAAASSILQKGLVREIALVDVDADKLKGEMMDLSHGAALAHPTVIRASTDYTITKESDICVITAGVRQKEGETRLDLMERNLEVFKKIVPELVKHSPNTVMLVVSNPCDILTWVVWKLSGLPAHRVLGSGTTLDSSRFRFLLAEKLGVSPRSVHGYFIGEHGDSSVPAWSGLSVGGVKLRSVSANLGKGEDEFTKIAEEVKKSAYDVIKLKGYTSWAIGLCVSMLCAAILQESEEVYPVSTLVKGIHGIEEEVFVSVPAVLSSHGVRDVIKQNLDEEEIAGLKKSVKSLNDLQVKLKL